MLTEQIVWAQERVTDQQSATWRDIAVPQVKDGIPPRPRSMTVQEWGELLKANKMLGTYRAYTDNRRVVAVLVVEHKVIRWHAESLTT